MFLRGTSLSTPLSDMFLRRASLKGLMTASNIRTASEILPRVYLADLSTASDEAKLAALGITHVISVIAKAKAPMFPRSLRTLHIPLLDDPDECILQYLPTTTSFIRDGLAESPDSRVMVSGRALYVWTG